MQSTQPMLVVPCFDEEQRMDERRFWELADVLPLVFVDDGSKDRTWAILERLSAHPQVMAIRLPQNVGKGEAVRHGMRAVIALGAPSVGFADADLATPPDELLRLLEVHLAADSPVTLGSRNRGEGIERRLIRRLIGRGSATAASLVLRHRFTDTQCGAKYFQCTPALSAALNEPFRSRWIFDVELIGRLMASGYIRGDFLEVSLRAWRDQENSKLTQGAVLRAVVELFGVERDLQKRRAKAIPSAAPRRLR